MVHSPPDPAKASGGLTPSPSHETPGEHSRLSESAKRRLRKGNAKSRELSSLPEGERPGETASDQQKAGPSSGPHPGKGANKPKGQQSAAGPKQGGGNYPAALEAAVTLARSTHPAPKSFADCEQILQSAIQALRAMQDPKPQAPSKAPTQPRPHTAAAKAAATVGAGRSRGPSEGAGPRNADRQEGDGTRGCLGSKSDLARLSMGEGEADRAGRPVVDPRRRKQVGLRLPRDSQPAGTSTVPVGTSPHKGKGTAPVPAQAKGGAGQSSSIRRAPVTIKPEFIEPKPEVKREPVGRQPSSEA